MSVELLFDWRVCWSASSNITFRGESSWQPYDGTAATAEDVERDVSGWSDPTQISEAFGLALDASGFDWWVEVRESR